MSMDAVQRLDRRGFLAAAAAMLASTSAPAIAQTFISDTPSSDVGFSRVEERPASPRSQVAASSVAAVTPAPASAPFLTDWRQRLLSGDRTILMRRDGAARRIRYCTADGMLDRDGSVGLYLSLVVAVACLAGAFGIDLAGSLASDLRPSDSGYAAVVYLVGSLNGFYVTIVIAMALFTLARRVAGKLDRIRRVTFDNTQLFWQYTVAQSLMGLAVVHLAGRMLE